ncbi:MAG: preprotein translocase subunit SecY [Chloroflexi bacterium]|nr:preprotein translocase subunit SecY [Chloroflexota bacterium]
MRDRGTSWPKPIQALFDAFSLPDLRAKLLFTFAILVVFRFVAHVPVPGIDRESLRQLFENNPLLGMLDLFSGGAMKEFSVAAMGVYPYITASIVMTLLVPVIPKLQALSQEGEAGRQKINQITHWLTVPLAALQGYAQLRLLQAGQGGFSAAIGPTTTLETVTIVITLCAGTMFLVWLGELITERGIGNGVSIIIFAGIVASFPQEIQRGYIAGQTNIAGLVAFVVLAVIIVALIVIFTEAHRRIPVQYARSQMRGSKIYRQTGSTHIPLRVNMAGMIPLIFAMSIMLFPAQVASYFVSRDGTPNFADSLVNFFQPTQGLYQLIYFFLVLAFAFFYTLIIFQQQDLAKTLQQQGGFVPGIRPGEPTRSYLNGVVNRITLGGAVFLAFVAVLPFLGEKATGITVLQLSSTGLLIMVGVALDTLKQLEAQLLMRKYEGFLR